MPFGYGKSPMRRPSRKSRRSSRRNSKAAVSFKKTVRVPLATKGQLARLSKQVRYNTSQSFGDLQKSQQRLIFATGESYLRGTISVQTPHIILHQAIQNNTPIHSLLYTVGVPPLGDTLTTNLPARWQNYVLDQVVNNNPVINNSGVIGTVSDTFIDNFDQLRQWPVALGVQSKFVHYKSLYTFNFLAKSCQGYYQIDLVTPRRSLQPSLSTTYTLPDGAAGFCGMCPGTNAEYLPNPTYFKRKRLARGYFNTANTDGELKTNPNFCVKLMVKNSRGRKLIVASQLDQTAPPPVISPAEIPLHQQMWIIVSSSIQQSAQTAASNLSYQCVRTNWWRDYLGSSH